MTLKSCLRCDWQGEREGRGCPNCGEQPLYLVGTSSSGEGRSPSRSHPGERSGEPASPANVAPVRHPVPSVDPSPSPTETVEPSGRSTRSAIAFVLAAFVLTVTLGTWLKAQEESSALSASTDAGAPDTPTSIGSPSPPEGIPPHEPPPNRTLSRVVQGVPFSFSAPPDWGPGPIKSLPDGSGSRGGSLLISTDIVGSQGAEAVIFWTSFPDGGQAHPCFDVGGPGGPSSPAELAATVVAAGGTELIHAPSDLTVGGYPATYVVVTVSQDFGCDPGFFYSWWHDECWGACWIETNVGDTIRVWIVDVDGTLLIIEAETTTQADADLKKEIQQIVGSIRFD